MNILLKLYMIFTTYSWFELEINYGLFFYPNWEFNYYSDIYLHNIFSYIPLLLSMVETNFNTNIFTKSLLDTLDLIYTLLIQDDSMSYFYWMLVDSYIYFLFNVTLFNFFFLMKSVDILNIFFFYDMYLVYILNDIMYHNILNYSLEHNFIIIYNIIISNITSTFVNIFFFIFNFLISYLFFINFNNLFRNNNIYIKFNFIISRFYFYLYNLSKEIRFNFELLIQFSLFFIFAWVFNLMSYDDLNLEFIELFHVVLVFFFFYVIIYLLFKYSFHYFAFLEPSVTEGKSSSFILKQLVRDISNTFALFLRFFLLLFRLNIYDGLDDFLDSYCLFFYDFDEDIVLFNNNINISNSNYTLDNSSDLDLQDKDNNLFNIEDFFKTYLFLFFEILYFFIFILEVLFRLSLALYILYLIIFEVHSVNCSYSEDNYFFIKKNI